MMKGAFFNELIHYIIDFIPRAQALLPPALVKPTLLRAEVGTRALVHTSRPNQVGLDFEKVKLTAVEVLGIKVREKLPPLGFNLPQINLPGSDPDKPGYFDITFLEDEMLII
jgi:hypothetical protein